MNGTAGSRRAGTAVFAVFALNGLLFASWLSRLPAVRDRLELSPAEIGVILLVGAAGSVISLPLTGLLVERLGTARAVGAAVVVGLLGTVLVSIAVAIAQPVLLAASLFLTMMGVGAWDVGMNLAGADVEQAIHRAVMPRFHAGYSLGTVLGAALGAGAAALGLAVTLHLIIIVVIVAVSAPFCLRSFLPGTQAARADRTPTGNPVRKPHAFAAWLEPRTVLIGVMVLAAALTEGAANDWLGLATVDGFAVPNQAGAIMLAIFMVAMTSMRLLGTSWLDLHGRVTVLRVCIALALVGLVTFCFAPWLWLAGLGAILWGLGAALGFPVGMSAASDDPRRAASRVSVAASIGYVAVLAGPPLLGLLAEQVGYRHALLVIAGPLLISLLITRVAAPVAVGGPGEDISLADHKEQ